MPSSLLTGLVSFWDMDQATGTTRTDALGLNDAADVNGAITQETGLIDFSSGYTPATNFLTTPTNLSLDPQSGDMTWAGWIYQNSFGSWAFFSKWGGVGNCYLMYVVTGIPNFYWFDGVGEIGLISTTTIPLNTWGFVVTWFDSVAMTANVMVNNNGIVNSVGYTPPVVSSTGGMSFGTDTAPGAQLDGRIDCFGVWNRVLTRAEIGVLYNAGLGLTYPFTAAPIWTDATSNAFDLQNIGGTGGTNPIGGGCAVFNGTDQYANYPSNSVLNTNTTDFSLCGWVNIDNVATPSQSILTKWSTIPRDYALYFNQSSPVFTAYSGATPLQVSSALTITSGTWHFVAFGVSQTSSELWISVDNETPAVTAFSEATGNDTDPFRVALDDSGHYFGGKIFSIGYWKGTDIRSSLTTMYNGGTPLNTAGMLTYTPTDFWPMDDLAPAPSGSTNQNFMLLGVG